MTCQKPMQTRHQNVMIGAGLRTKKMRAVIRILNASASHRKSEHEWRGVVGRNWKESGNTDGKPIEVRPCAVNGK